MRYVVRLSRETFPENNDSRIIAAAIEYQSYHPTIFRTDDLSCAFLARTAGLTVQYGPAIENKEYTGYKKLVYTTEDETAEFYSNLNKGNIYNLHENEYLFIYVGDKLIDIYKCKDRSYEQVKYPCFDSKILGKIKPKDEY